MRTDFYKMYVAGCSEKYPNYENLLHHCCEQVKSSVTDVFTNYISSLYSCHFSTEIQWFYCTQELLVPAENFTVRMPMMGLESHHWYISSFLSSDGHLKPICVCKFNLGSLHIVMNIVITYCRFVLSNCWYGSYLRAVELNKYPLKTTKTGLKHN